MDAYENALADWINALDLGPNDSVLIPVDIFDMCKRMQDPDHDNLETCGRFHFCVQSNVNPINFGLGNNQPQQVGERYLFRLCLKVRLNEAFVEGTPAGGNTRRQVELLANLTPEGFRYVGPVPEADLRPVTDYLRVGNRDNVENERLKEAILNFRRIL